MDCAGSAPSLRATTVALLASRFPYVTPSGVVTSDCAGEGSLRSQQVVDGGYADNDGIGTVVDLTGQWVPGVRAHNEAVLAAPGSGALLVPVLVYLDNGPGSDLEARPGGATNELLVPLVTKGAATAGLSSTDSQLHRAAEVLAVERLLPGCAPAPTGSSPGPSPVCGAVEGWRGPVVKVFYQPTRPSIAAPLGWVLSRHSLDTLRCARDDQVARAGLAALAPAGACGDQAPVTSPEMLPDGGAVDRCADPAGRDESPLSRKGYGTMWSALCLAKEAAAAS